MSAGYSLLGYPAWHRFLCCSLFDENEKRSLCQVVFTIRQHPSKSVDGKISKSFGVRWRQLARARQKNKHDLRDFFFTLVREGNSKKPLPSRVLLGRQFIGFPVAKGRSTPFSISAFNKGNPKAAWGRSNAGYYCHALLSPNSLLPLSKTGNPWPVTVMHKFLFLHARFLQSSKST